jgi:catechol 2,3-dioxygenase-like lactoylglutathione lyase family enzyme
MTMEREIENLVTQYESRGLTRRQLVATLAAMVGAGSTTVGAARQNGPVAQGRTINHVSLAVSDVEASAEFYQRLLGLDVVSRPSNGGINMGLSDGFLGVYPIPEPGRVHHFCIGVDDYDADRIKGRFDEIGYEASVSRDPANRTSGGDQLYFSDPDGTMVQLGENGYQG